MRLLFLNKTITLAAAVLASMASNAVHAYSERDVLKLKSLNACQECNLSEADLSGLNFDGAEFIDTDFLGVNASRSTFAGAYFEHSVFANSNLKNSVFDDTDFGYTAQFVNSNLSGATIRNIASSVISISNSDLTNASIIDVEEVYLWAQEMSSWNFQWKDLCEPQWRMARCDFFANLDGNYNPRLIIKNTNFSGSQIFGNLTDVDFSTATLKNTKISPKAILCRTKFPWGIENKDCAKPKTERIDLERVLDKAAKKYSSRYHPVDAWNEIEKDGTTLEQLFVATVYKPNLEMLIPTFQAAFDKRIAEARQRRAQAIAKKAAAEKKAADEAKAEAERRAKFEAEWEQLRTKKVADEAAKRVTPDDVKTIMQHIAKCWQPPLGAAGNELLTVDLLVKLAEDGQVVTVQIKDQLRYTLDSYFKASAIAAERAVFDCSPLPIPPEKYEQLKLLDISFNPEFLSR